MEEIISAARIAAQAQAPGKDAAISTLRKFVLGDSASTVAKQLRIVAERGDNFAEAVSAVLFGARPGLFQHETSEDLKRCAEMRMIVCKQVLATLASKDAALPSTQAEAAVAALAGHVPYLSSASDIFNLMEAILDAFESDQPLAVHALDLLPTALPLLELVGTTVPEAAAGQASDAAAGFILRVLNHPWPGSSIASVLNALHSLPLTATNLTLAVQRGAARARIADLHDLPSIVHQLLVLAGSVARDAALNEIARLFEKLDATAKHAASDAHRLRLLEVEGAVLLHLEMAFKHDAEMAKAWIRRLKAGAGPTSPFSFSLSLTVGGIQRYQQEVYAALIQCLTKAHVDAARRAAAPWLPDPCSPSYSSNSTTLNSRGAASIGDPTFFGMEDALLQCVRNSAHGQGLLVQPLVALGVALLDAEASGASAFFASRGGEFSAQTNSHAASQPPEASLGVRLLVETFAAHKECRRDVLELCSTRLVGVTESAALPFIAVMRELVRLHPALVERHLAEVRAAMENLTLLPPAAATALIAALWPLCRGRRDIADFVVIILRKAMFSREVGPRVIAARGFLHVIGEELRAASSVGGDNDNMLQAETEHCTAPSCSQAAPTLSQLGPLGGSNSGGATLLHELMGFLRRCLSQQADVRCIIYQGLPDLLAADPAAAEPIAELLLPHLATFAERDATLAAPLKLETCVRAAHDGDGVRLVEPLPHLLACVGNVLRKGQWPDAALLFADDSDGDDEDVEGGEAFQDVEDAAAGRALHRLFSSIRRRLVGCPLEDFCFDQSTIFHSSEVQGELNQAMAGALLGCYEAFMEDVVEEIDQIQGGKGANAGASPIDTSRKLERLAEALLALTGQHRRLTNLVTDGMKGGKSRRVEGLTQAVGVQGDGTRRKGAAAAKKTADTSIVTAAAIMPIDKRVPVLSARCLSRLLDAVVQDGLVPGGCTQGAAASQSGHVKLARDVAFQTFLFISSQRVLQSSSAIGPGLRDTPEVQTRCKELSSSLFEATKTAILACTNSRTPAAGSVAAKKEKDPHDALLQAAVGALERLISCAHGNLVTLASLLRPIPAATSASLVAAKLPPTTSEAGAAVATVAARLPPFKQLLEALVRQACAKEVEALCNCIELIIAVLPKTYAAAVAGWADEEWETAPEALSRTPSAVRALLQLRLRCHATAGSSTDAKVAEDLGRAIVESTNSNSPSGATMATLTFHTSQSMPLLSSKSLNVIMATAVAHVDSSLTSVDWALNQLKAASTACTPSGGGHLSAAAGGGGKRFHGREDGDAAGAMAAALRRVEWEDATFARLEALARATAELAAVNVSGPFVDSLTKMLTRLYRQLGLAARTQIAGRGQAQTVPGRAFQQLVAFVNSSLTPRVYTLITDLQVTNGMEENEPNQENADNNEENVKGKKKGSKGAAVTRAKRDMRSVPNLVFQVEEWEKQLVRVSKAGKLNLLVDAKRATVRDFRIKDGGNDAKRARTEIPAAAAGMVIGDMETMEEAECGEHHGLDGHLGEENDALQHQLY